MSSTTIVDNNNNNHSPSSPSGPPIIDDDGFRYEAVEMALVEEDASLELPPDDDLDAIVNKMMHLTQNAGKTGNNGSTSNYMVSNTSPSLVSPNQQGSIFFQHPNVSQPRTDTLPSVADDFIRNFLIRTNMNRSLDCFNSEWFELKAKGKFPNTQDDQLRVPDIYVQNQQLEDSVAQLRLELAQAQDVAAKAQSTWDRFRRERDFHRMHHKRVVQEKNKLVVDLKRLKAHYEKYEPMLEELRTKYELAMKEKMLMRLERDRLAARVAALEATLRAGGGTVSEGMNEGGVPTTTATNGTNLRSNTTNGPTSAPVTSPSLANNSTGRRGGILAPTAASKARVEERFNSGPMPPIQAAAIAKAAKEAEALARATRIPDSKLPSEDLVNPYLGGLTFEPARVGGYKLTGTLKGHGAPVSALAFHPTKPLFVSASDDSTWRMWSVQSASDAQLEMSGEGHRAWLADTEFHPTGTLLATCSGDGLVKLWDLASQSCAATLSDHTQTAWSVSFHHLGDFLASASMDHTTKLWDIHTGKVRQTFRGHADSVNAVAFQPYSVYLATGSGDKTVSIWDARSGLCIQSFFGHTNAVNDVIFNLAGDTIASCDADGNVKLWDIRMVAERATISLGSQAVHAIAFDRSAQVLAAACDDGVIRVLDSAPGSGLSMIVSLRGHEDAVTDIAFDPTAQYLISASNDATVRIWSEGVIKGAGVLSTTSGKPTTTGTGGHYVTNSSPGYPDGDD